MDYDSTGIRVKKTLGNSVTLYPFSGYEIEPDGTIIKRFREGNEILAAKKSSPMVDPVKLFYHDDHLGGINVVTDQSGTRAELNEYDPWGLVSRSEPPNENSSPEPARRFTGKELDEETDLYYYDARYYDQNLGRFESPDSVVPNATDPQALNRYSYVRNNPVALIDPSGHEDETPNAISSFLSAIWKGLSSIFSSSASQTGATDESPLKPNVPNAKDPAAQGAGFKGNPAPNCPGSCTVASSDFGKVEGTVTGKPNIGAQAALIVATIDGEGDVPRGAPVATGKLPAGLSDAEKQALQEAFASRRAQMTGKAATEEPNPSVIYRQGTPSPSNLTPRTGEDALSFRDTKSNPIPTGDRPVFRPGDKYFGIDISRLPAGSVTFDGNGHVSVRNVSPEVLRGAIVERGSFNK